MSTDRVVVLSEEEIGGVLDTFDAQDDPAFPTPVRVITAKRKLRAALDAPQPERVEEYRVADWQAPSEGWITTRSLKFARKLALRMLSPRTQHRFVIEAQATPWQDMEESND